jgi:hypothetical protein
MTAIMGWRMRIMSPTHAAIPGRAASAGFRRLLRENSGGQSRKHILSSLELAQKALSGPAQTINPPPHPYRFYAHHDCDYGVANAYHVADPRSHSRSCSFGGISSAFKRKPSRQGGGNFIISSLIWHRASSLHSAAPSRAQLSPGQVCGFPSPHPRPGPNPPPYQNGAHCVMQNAADPRLSALIERPTVERGGSG